MSNKEAVKRHYYKNREKYFERNRRVKAAQREYLKDLKNRPCADCGERYPYYVMDFDHRDGSDKKFELGRIVGAGWTRIKLEVAKCDVVCANCHRKRTFARMVE